MERAARDEAAGRPAALRARSAADLTLLGRVHSALLGQLGGTLPMASEPVLGPVGYLARRTLTLPRFEPAGAAVTERDAR
jgi:hypothetical protein